MQTIEFFAGIGSDGYLKVLVPAGVTDDLLNHHKCAVCRTGELGIWVCNQSDFPGVQESAYLMKMKKDGHRLKLQFAMCAQCHKDPKVIADVQKSIRPVAIDEIQEITLGKHSCKLTALIAPLGDGDYTHGVYARSCKGSFVQSYIEPLDFGLASFASARAFALQL